MALAAGPPDPQVKPKLQAALERFVPDQAKRAEANPVIRANLLLPAARFGLREEMKQSYGFGWRDYVRGVTTTFDIGDNLAFRDKIDAELTALDAKWSSRIDPAFTLNPKKVSADKTLPNVIVVAADGNGNIVRYYEAGQTAAYFGSLPARSADNGLYDPSSESRQVASTGKMLLAIAIANQGRDTTDTLYVDPQAPAAGLDTCAKGASRQARKAIVAFACSLNAPLINRGAVLGQAPVKRLIDGFGFAMPPAAQSGGTPPSTAVVLGQIAGAPRRVHFMSSVILASLIGRGTKPVKPPTLITAYDYTQKGKDGGGLVAEARPAIIPKSLIRPGAVPLIKSLLEAPLCYQAGGTSYGTLKSLSQWCAHRRGDLRLHFAKTGTSVSLDPDAPSTRGRPVACSSPMALPIPMSCLSGPARHQSPGPTICTPHRLRRRCSMFCYLTSPDTRSRIRVATSCRGSRLHRQQRVFPQHPHFLHCMAKRWRARARAHANDHRRTSNSAPSARTGVPSSPQGSAFAAGCAKRVENANEGRVRNPPTAEHRSAAVAT